MKINARDTAAIIVLLAVIAVALTPLVVAIRDIAAVTYESNKSDQQRMKEAVQRAWH
jgi:hypothetical protein